jgi:hypothetical protein
MSMCSPFLFTFCENIWSSFTTPGSLGVLDMGRWVLGFGASTLITHCLILLLNPLPLEMMLPEGAVLGVWGMISLTVKAVYSMRAGVTGWSGSNWGGGLGFHFAARAHGVMVFLVMIFTTERAVRSQCPTDFLGVAPAPAALTQQSSVQC